MTTKLTTAERQAIQSISNPAWWRRPITWSGIANDIAKVALAAEERGMMSDARQWARLRDIATKRSLA